MAKNDIDPLAYRAIVQVVRIWSFADLRFLWFDPDRPHPLDDGSGFSFPTSAMTCERVVEKIREKFGPAGAAIAASLPLLTKH